MKLATFLSISGLDGVCLPYLIPNIRVFGNIHPVDRLTVFDIVVYGT